MGGKTYAQALAKAVMGLTWPALLGIKWWSNWALIAMLLAYIFCGFGLAKGLEKEKDPMGSMPK